MNQPHPAHPVPASGLFGETWHLARNRQTPPACDQFEAHFVANDRSATEDAVERAHRLSLVA